MKIKQNFANKFNCTFVIDNIDYLNQELIIDYHIGSDKKYYYKITSSNDIIQDFFGSKYIQGVKGFSQHVISGSKYHLVYKEKNSQLEVITWNNSVCIYGKLLYESN